MKQNFCAKENKEISLQESGNCYYCLGYKNLLVCLKEKNYNTKNSKHNIKDLTSKYLHTHYLCHCHYHRSGLSMARRSCDNLDHLINNHLEITVHPC